MNDIFTYRFRALGFALSCFIYGSIGPASAAPVSGLFEAAVPVAGQQAEQRTEAIRAAFQKVLVKVTGSRSVINRSELKDTWAKASHYVQQYRYESMPAVENDPVQSEGQDQLQRLLNVAFDAQAVTGLLQERHIAVWGDDRPNALVWIGVEDGGKRRLGLPDMDVDLFGALDESANLRGLPTLYPLMDLEDQASLQVADLWGDFEQNIRKASNRYTPDVIITGRLIQVAPERWTANWRLYQGNRVTNWRDQAQSKTVLAGNGMEHVVDVLSDRFTPVAGAGDLSRVRLQVSGVTDLTLYTRVSKFLSSRNVVENSSLVHVATDRLIYELRVRGGLQGLQQGLQLGGLLELVSEAGAAEDPSAANVDLFYTIR